MITINSWNNVHVVLSIISVIYDPVQPHNKLLERHTVGVFATYFLSTTVGSTSPYVLGVYTVTTVDRGDEYDTDTDNNDTIT